MNIFNSIFKLNDENKNSSKRDIIINNIKNEISNGSLLDSAITNILMGDKKDLYEKDDNIIYQITSSNNQNNNNYDNISNIILGECEKLLKQKYYINENQSLLIFKIDYYLPGSLIPIIGYDVFHPVTKQKLDLTICEKANIYLNIPVSINEDNLFKYDPKNEYYKDECYPSTTENGTDILINDRHNEFNNNNMSLCELNCSFIGYDNKTKKAKCECGIKSKQLVISELINSTDILSYNFETKDESSNMIIMKCYYTLFTKNGFIKNIGSYILLFTILLFVISIRLKIVVYIIKEVIDLKNENNIIQEMNIKETMDVGIKEKNTIKKKNSKKKKKKKKIKKKRNYKEGKIEQSRIKTSSNPHSFSKLKLKNNKGIIPVNSVLNEKIIKEKSIQKNNSESLIYLDYEINSFSYNDALKYDKRSFFCYYFSLIKTKQFLLFSFWPIKDYNSKIIKIDLLFLSFSIYCFINCLFFDEPTIHKIYEDKGIYNFIYLIPHILYSFIASHFLITIIKFVSLSEKNIHEIKREKTIELASDTSSKLKKCLIIKYICFFIISILFLLFFWYYLSSFGAVYQNTQIYLIKNILISFGFSLLYPFFINIIPCILRIYSLKDPNRSCIYKFIKIIQFM